MKHDDWEVVISSEPNRERLPETESDLTENQLTNSPHECYGRSRYLHLSGQNFGNKGGTAFNHVLYICRGRFFNEKEWKIC